MTPTLFLSTLIFSYQHFAAGHTCTTPEGIQGTCVDRDLCENMLQWKPSPVSTHCLEQNNVCCGLESNTEAMPEERTKDCQLTALPPEPGTECCGVDAGGGDNRIVGGTETSVDEFPWLALIEYTYNNTIYVLCGGALISGKYVMTAGHCVAGSIVVSTTPVKVRLGEYDTSNPGPDCVEVEGGGEDCTDGAVSIRIEKIIQHPDYNPESKLRRHDIALIRLFRMAQFTDFIRPICLPTEDFTTASTDYTKLYAAGWGAVSDVQSSSNVKLKVDLPYLSYQDCQSSYSVPNRRIKLWEGQICAGGVRGKDSCKGDSGGPLMRKNKGLFELVGIVSFGASPCGIENVAGVYTKVFHYLPWIRSQIVV